MKRLLLSLLLACLATGLSLATGLLAHADSSGDTGMGYTWTDNQSPGRTIAFQWVDIAESGTRIASLSDCDDCLAADVATGFEFSFYGNAYSSVNINSNGALQFVDTDDPWGPGRLPTSELVGPVILPLWGDWDPRSSGDIYVQTMSSWPGTSQRAFIVQWDNVESWDCGRGDNATWQVVLLEHGGIIFQYLDIVVGDPECDYGADMTIGIQQGFGECFIMYSHRFASVPDGSAIAWSPQPSSCDQPEPTATSMAPPPTGIEPSNPGEEGSLAQEPALLPNDGGGPSGGDRAWTSLTGPGLSLALAGVVLFLCGLGMAISRTSRMKKLV